MPPLPYPLNGNLCSGPQHKTGLISRWTDPSACSTCLTDVWPAKDQTSLPQRVPQPPRFGRCVGIWHESTTLFTVCWSPLREQSHWFGLRASQCLFIKTVIWEFVFKQTKGETERRMWSIVGAFASNTMGKMKTIPLALEGQQRTHKSIEHVSAAGLISLPMTQLYIKNVAHVESSCTALWVGKWCIQ